MKRPIVRVTPSPMNKRRWCLELDCGHEVWATANRKPRAAAAECSRCTNTATGPLRVKFMEGDYRREPKTNDWCACCQRDIKPGDAYRLVRLVHNGPFALHPDDEVRFTPGCALKLEDGEVEPDQGDLGTFKIGPICARKLGLEWSRAPDTRATARPLPPANSGPT